MSSAGTKGCPLKIYSQTIERVKFHGADMSRHKYTILNQEIVDDSNVLICMTHQHQDFVKTNFGKDSFLFNELAIGKKIDLEDNVEAKGKYSDMSIFIQETIDKIHDGLPSIYEKLKANNL